MLNDVKLSWFCKNINHIFAIDVTYMHKRSNKLKIVGKIINGIIITLLVLILLINILIIIQTKTKPDSVPSVFGLKPFIVLSGSMESKISVDNKYNIFY